MQLIVSRKVTRVSFPEEQYAPSDDVLAVVAAGSFSVEDENGPWIVGPGEGFCFRNDRTYSRHILEPATMVLYRYRDEEHAFPEGTLHFGDAERFFSTLRMQDALENKICADDDESRNILWKDLQLQFRLTNGAGDPALATDSIVREAAREIRAHMADRLNLNQMAGRYGLSYVHFARRFKADAGIPPSVYLTRLRLRQACRLLEESTLPIREIAPLCGFSNEYYFSNFFREHTGTPPGEYRSAVRDL